MRQETSKSKTKKYLYLFIGISLVVLIAVGLWLTQPWRLWTSSTLDEDLPSQKQNNAQTMTEKKVGPEDSAPEKTEKSSTPEIVGSGDFQSLDHETSGKAKLVKLADGKYLIRVENLASVDGPDLKLVVTSASGKYSNIREENYLDLGSLKATHGNHNYPIPADTDISKIKSVVIWCDRFSSPFGSATLSK